MRSTRPCRRRARGDNPRPGGGPLRLPITQRRRCVTRPSEGATEGEGGERLPTRLRGRPPISRDAAGSALGRPHAERPRPGGGAAGGIRRLPPPVSGERGARGGTGGRRARGLGVATSAGATRLSDSHEALKAEQNRSLKEPDLLPVSVTLCVLTLFFLGIPALTYLLSRVWYDTCQTSAHVPWPLALSKKVKFKHGALSTICILGHTMCVHDDSSYSCRCHFPTCCLEELRTEHGRSERDRHTTCHLLLVDIDVYLYLYLHNLSFAAETCFSLQPRQLSLCSRESRLTGARLNPGVASCLGRRCSSETKNIEPRQRARPAD